MEACDVTEVTVFSVVGCESLGTLVVSVEVTSSSFIVTVGL